MARSKLIASIFCIISSTVIALNVTTISDCPALTPRTAPPIDITDLRIDDIKIFGSLGDSTMAGYGLIDIKPGFFGLFSENTILEHRGLSYLMGADQGAVTVANFMKRYNPNLHGPSVGGHISGYLRGDYKLPYHLGSDYLNTAQVGAMALYLHYELDYLIGHVTDPLMVDVNAQKEWKMIPIHIGSNDICRSCTAEFANVTTADVYASYIETAIQRIQSSIPNVIVNLVGMFNLSDVYTVYPNNPNYCSNRILMHPCSCFDSVTNLPKVDKLVTEYNQNLQSIATKYVAKPGGTFGVIFMPMPIDITSFPIEAYSNIDCFHPSIVGHQWIAKAVWNQLFLKKDVKPSVLTFDATEQIYCPIDGDRIPM